MSSHVTKFVHTSATSGYYQLQFFHTFSMTGCLLFDGEIVEIEKRNSWKLK